MTIEATDLVRLMTAVLAGRSPVSPLPSPSDPMPFRDLLKAALRDSDTPVSVGVAPGAPALGALGASEDALMGLARRDLALRALEAMQAAPLDARRANPVAAAPDLAGHANAAPAMPPTPGPAPATTGAGVPEPTRTLVPSGPARAVPAPEGAVIEREATRAGVDPALLAALRRVENGRPGREFGVLSVPAPTLDDQARVAATSIRNAAARFERQGGVALDPVSGRYTDAFLRFFSTRYAPVGAANDPQGLNRYHAQNLQRLYARMRTAEDGTAQT